MRLLDFFRATKIKEENDRLKQNIHLLEERIKSLGVDEYYQVKEKIDTLNVEMEKRLCVVENDIQEKLRLSNSEVISNNETISRLREEISSLTEQNEKLSKQCLTQTRKISKSKELYSSIEYAINNFFISDVPYENCKLNKHDFQELELISPSVTLKLHCMDVKDLRKSYRANEQQINKLLEQYSARYTTKANKSIYNLMVIALRAELQNILYNLKYEKLDKSIEDVQLISAKYLKIAGEGNQSIAGTLTKFIGEIEYLFINSVKIEYNYYVKKEQARQEQLAIREQMRQEADERKALEVEKKKIEKEESKYHSEIEKLQHGLTEDTPEDEAAQLRARILELQGQLSNVIIKKQEISNLQNGKAGNVYIISNLGSFGENIFKIGMTRRIDPIDRINELGSASVPFKFDVHSFIFSEDAVSLENKIHNILTKRRLNKVNMRKEFFRVSIDELENLVTDIEPTAEFNKTMLAEEFRQSQSSDEIYTSDYIYDESDDDE